MFWRFKYHFDQIQNLNRFRKLFQITMILSSSVKLKLIPSSQASNLVSRSTEFFERIVMHMAGLLFYVHQDLNFKLLTNYPMHPDFEILALELKLSKTNRLIISTYKPSSLSGITLTSQIKNILTFYWPTHDNILLTG